MKALLSKGKTVGALGDCVEPEVEGYFEALSKQKKIFWCFPDCVFADNAKNHAQCWFALSLLWANEAADGTVEGGVKVILLNFGFD